MPVKPTLVDTSAWIDYFRRKDALGARAIEALLEEGRAYTAGLIVAELLQGAVSEEELRAIEELVQVVRIVEDRFDLWTQAGKLSRLLRQKGVTIHIVDCYIATLAIAHRLHVLSLDRHFRLLSRYTTLQLTPA